MGKNYPQLRKTFLISLEEDQEGIIKIRFGVIESFEGAIYKGCFLDKSVEFGIGRI